MTTKEVVKRALREMVKMREPCVLCGGTSTGVSLFIPDNSRLYLAPMGKTRLILYSVCLSCTARMHDIERVIQAKLLAECECVVNA